MTYYKSTKVNSRQTIIRNSAGRERTLLLIINGDPDRGPSPGLFAEVLQSLARAVGIGVAAAIGIVACSLPLVVFARGAVLSLSLIHI